MKDKKTQKSADDNLSEQTELNVDYKEAWMRATADYQNLQREMSAKQAEWTQYANKNLLTDLIPVIEHYNQALKHVPEDQKDADWVKGIYQIKKQVDDFMSSNGLERIKTVGEQFNAEYHEAMGKRPVDGIESDEVIDEIQGGYMLNNKVIQAAKVIVAE